jgi:hypothetical protein
VIGVVFPMFNGWLHVVYCVFVFGFECLPTPIC